MKDSAADCSGPEAVLTMFMMSSDREAACNGAWKMRERKHKERRHEAIGLYTVIEANEVKTCTSISSSRFPVQNAPHLRMRRIARGNHFEQQLGLGNDAIDQQQTLDGQRGALVVRGRVDGDQLAINGAQMHVDEHLCATIRESDDAKKRWRSKARSKREIHEYGIAIQKAAIKPVVVNPLHRLEARIPKASGVNLIKLSKLCTRFTHARTPQ